MLVGDVAQAQSPVLILGVSLARLPVRYPWFRLQQHSTRRRFRRRLHCGGLWPRRFRRLGSPLRRDSSRPRSDCDQAGHARYVGDVLFIGDTLSLTESSPFWRRFGGCLARSTPGGCTAAKNCTESYCDHARAPTVEAVSRHPLRSGEIVGLHSLGRSPTNASARGSLWGRAA